MTTETIDFLANERSPIVDAALAALEQMHADHYEAAGSIVTRQRFEALYDSLLESLTEHDVGLIVVHTREIARERFSRGYDLSEVQTAFTELEAAIWAHVFVRLEPDRFARTLGLVSTVLGTAKDALAREWVSLAIEAHAPSLHLRATCADTAGV